MNATGETELEGCNLSILEINMFGIKEARAIADDIEKPSSLSALFIGEM